MTDEEAHRKADATRDAIIHAVDFVNHQEASMLATADADMLDVTSSKCIEGRPTIMGPNAQDVIFAKLDEIGKNVAAVHVTLAEFVGQGGASLDRRIERIVGAALSIHDEKCAVRVLAAKAEKTAEETKEAMTEANAEIKGIVKTLGVVVAVFVFLVGTGIGVFELFRK
jgi:hypothetical protein